VVLVSAARSQAQVDAGDVYSTTFTTSEPWTMTVTTVCPPSYSPTMPYLGTPNPAVTFNPFALHGDGSFFDIPHFAPIGSGSSTQESAAIGTYELLEGAAQCAWSLLIKQP
jgi:hypothetical protein